MKIKIKLLIATTVIICLLFVANAKNTEDIISVDTHVVEKTTIINQIIANGNIEEKSKSYISINQNGTVKKIFYSKGDKVSQGDILLTIETNDKQSNSANNSIIDLIDNKNVTILDTTNVGEIEVISNVDGIVTQIPTVTGEAILSGIPFLSLCDTDNLVATISISEKNIKDTQIGQSVILTGDSFDGSIFGKISQIMPYTTASLDILSGTSNVSVEAIVELDFLMQDIIVGCSVQAKITTEHKNNAITIPLESISQENKQEYVYLLVENHAVKQEITTGYEVYDEVEVLSGLKEGDIIIKSSNVFDGQEVKYES